ncbi:MAG: restriction endonuclease subunit S [Nitrosomonadales bacterium]|nr:restriction endonuclease subunit S [Nitrosomonadales bacterium]
MNMDASNLPKGWCCTSLENIASWGSGGTPSRNVERYFQGTIPWVKTGELEGKYIRKTEEHISEDALKNSSAKIFPKGSVGIAMYGATIGKLSIWGIDASTNQACAVGIPNEAINNEFLYYYLLSERQNLIKAGKGGAQPNLSQGIIKEWPINLPPHSEQHRIVAKIEELFSELDKGIENLKTAQAQLKVYRQALLKHAFEGKLTAQWRAENQDKLETAAALLKRIQQERAQCYQQQLKSPSVPLLQRGKTTSAAAASVPPFEKGGLGGISGGRRNLKPKAPKPLPPLTAEELAELPELPEGWGWIKFGELCEKIFDGTHFSPKSFPTGKYKYITAKNIKEGRLDLSNITYLDEDAHREIYSRCDVQFNDVLYIKDGATTGIAVVNKLEEEFSLLSSVGVFRFPKSAVIPEYAAYFLNSNVTRHRMLKEVAGVAITRLTLVKLNRAGFALASLGEQQQIVQELDSKLSEVDQLEQTITTSLQQAEALRQSILKKAFSGQLVPQDPHDEPASALLARIKAARATAEKNSAVRQRSKRG